MSIIGLYRIDERTCYCEDDGGEPICDYHEDNDEGICMICGHKRDCHEFPK